MTVNTPKKGLPKGQGSDNERDYLKGAITGGGLWTALDTLDNAILDTLVDAKGDLIAATAADTVARLVVGSNDQVLIADSTQAAGMRWGKLGDANQTDAGHRGARAFNSADISIPNNTNTIITLNSENYDTDPNGEIHSTSSNTSRMTIRTAGKYLVLGQVQWAVNATGERLAQIRLNGTTNIAISTTILGSGTYGLIQQVLVVHDFSASDYVELVAYQDSGGALNVSAAANPPFFSVTKV